MIAHTVAIIAPSTSGKSTLIRQYPALDITDVDLLTRHLTSDEHSALQALRHRAMWDVHNPLYWAAINRGFLALRVRPHVVMCHNSLEADAIGVPPVAAVVLDEEAFVRQARSRQRDLVEAGKPPSVVARAFEMAETNRALVMREAKARRLTVFTSVISAALHAFDVAAAARESHS